MPRRARRPRDLRGAGRAGEPRRRRAIRRRPSGCRWPSSRAAIPTRRRPARLPDVGRSGSRHLQLALVLPRLRGLGRARSRHHPRSSSAATRSPSPRSTAPSSTSSTSSSTACWLTGAEAAERRAEQLTGLPRPPGRGGHRPRRLHQRGERSRPRRPAQRARIRHLEPVRDLLRLASCHDGDARPPGGTAVRHPRRPLPPERQLVSSRCRRAS